MAAKRKASTVGNTGGPGTATGVVYQHAIAALLLVQELERFLDAPSDSPAVVRLEPRHVVDGVPTAWDAHVDTRHTSLEMKARPTRQDVLDFARGAGDRTRSMADARVTLICGRSNGPMLTHLEMLLKRAEEARDDEELKQRLAHDHRLTDVAPILSEFGETDLPQRLRRVAVQVRSDADAISLARELAGAVVGRERAGELVRFMRDRALAAATRREAIAIADLVPELTSNGYRLTAPARRIFADLPERIRPLEGIMSRLDYALPIDVVAAALGTTRDALLTDVAPLVAAACVVIQGDFIGLARRAQKLETANREWSPALGAAILRGLIQWLDARPPHGAQHQAHNIVAIAEILVSSDAVSVASVYMAVEKKLKSLGDKRLVLKLADLAIHAAGLVQPPTEQTARWRAHAMVCGFSWSYQRLGKLDRALNHANESLALGESIGWVRNTAFCEKCTGRLHRLQAERTSVVQSRAHDLASSEQCLVRALRAFENDLELPAEKRKEERGDCESLLGRTLLVAGRLDEARQAAERARAHLDQAHGKAFVDLQLLRADLSLADNEPDDAEAHAGTARDALADAGAEGSELRGRLYLTLGRIARRRGQVQEADAQFAAAEKTGRQMGDAILTAEARWERLSPSIDETAKSALRDDIISVRVKAVELYQNALQTTSAASRRSQTRAAQPPREYWIKLLEEARRQAAIEDGGVV